jgi:phage tail sheath gpL-like
MYNKNIDITFLEKLSLDTSYQISDQLALRFQRRKLKCEKLTDDGRQVMAKAHIAFGKVS